MYDISVKNVKKGKNLYIIFLVAGLFATIIFAFIMISNSNKLKSLDSTVTSTKVEINTHKDSDGNILYSPTYYYEVDGIEYTCPSTSSSSAKPKTDNANVYYDSKNPSECMTEYSKSSNKFCLIGVAIGVLFIVVAIINMVKVNKRVNKIKELNNRGKLVKNLPYRLEPSGIIVNDVEIQRPVVDYTLPSGSTVTLYGDPRMDKKMADADGMVDIVIDENDISNYFIDFEINRLTGNLPTDYFNKPTNNVTQSNNIYQNNTQNTFNNVNTNTNEQNLNQAVQTNTIINTNQNINNQNNITNTL